MSDLLNKPDDVMLVSNSNRTSVKGMKPGAVPEISAIAVEFFAISVPLLPLLLAGLTQIVGSIAAYSVRCAMRTLQIVSVRKS